MKQWKRGLAVVILLQASLAAMAANWYVDRTAPGANNGTSWADAWRSFPAIQWSRVQPGDTVYISGGSTTKTYNETLSIQASGTASSPITIRPGQAAGHNGTVIITSGGNGISTNSRAWLTVNGEVGGQRRIRLLNNKSHGIYTGEGDDTGLTFTYLAIEGNGTSGQHGIQVRGRADRIEISHCLIKSNYQDGINLYLGASGSRYDQVVIHHNEILSATTTRGDDGIQAGGGGGLTIYNNYIHDLKAWSVGHPDGIQTHMRANYLKIYNNVFHDIANSGMFIDPTQTGTHAHLRIYNNLIYQTDGGLSSMRGIQIYAASSSGTIVFDDLIVANNVFADIKLWGLLFKVRSGTGRLRNTTIANNIAYNCYFGNSTGSAIAVTMSYSPGADNVQFKNNMIHQGPSGSRVVQWSGRSYTDAAALNQASGSAGNQMCVPAFVSYVARRLGNDFRLKPTCNGVDRGLALAAFNTDLAGLRRPLGAGWDIGPYETAGNGQTGGTTPRAPSGLRVVQ